MEAHGIIPARYASSRFPGKPLADILGKPMFLRVWERAGQSPHLSSVTLATDDERIFAAAREHAVPVVMTGEHASGTDRVCEAAERLNLPPDAIIVNIQGDEPILDPAMLEELLQPFLRDHRVRASTLARPTPRGEALSPDRVKVVLKAGGEALYFSRAMIPFERDDAGAGNRQSDCLSACLVHLGFYAFRLETLRLFTSLPPSPLELAEKLEQLRLLENNIPLHVALTERECHSVDSPEDLARVVAMLRQGDA